MTAKTFLCIIFPFEVQAAHEPGHMAVKSKRPTIPIRGPFEKLNVCFGYIPSSNPRGLRHAQRQHVLLQRMEVKLIVIEDEYTRTFSISLLM